VAEALWEGVAEAYAQSFAGLCAGAVPAMLDGLPRQGRLLDVGCGTGDLVAKARRAGIDAIGVEPDPEMAALAGRVLDEEVVVAGLPDLPVADDGFDVVLANFVLTHVDQPRAAARELARVAAPGGVVRTTIWGRTPPPQAVMWNGLLDQVEAVRPAMPRLPEDQDFDRSPDGLAGILSEAGLAVTDAGTKSWQWRIAPEDLWAGLTSVGNFGVVFRAQSEDVRTRLRAAYDALGEPWRDDETFGFDVECVSVEARVPRS
jgi:SAM-dependent methyltransferase